MRTSVIFGAKNFGFFKMFGMSARTRGVKPVRTFFGQGRGGQFFTILCGRLLWPLDTFSKKLFGCLEIDKLKMLKATCLFN